METQKALARKITDAYFFYDPYNGADYEDVLQAVEEGLNDPEQIAQMLDELAGMILDV